MSKITPQEKLKLSIQSLNVYPIEPNIIKDMLNDLSKILSNAVTLKGFVARDENGLLFLHYKKPNRYNGMWLSSSLISNCLKLPDDSFPSLTWEDEPVEVEIQTKIVEENK